MSPAVLSRALLAWLILALFAAPSEARFLQVDPVGYQDQVNLYAYVGDDPLNHNDPTGRENGSTTCMLGACDGPQTSNLDPQTARAGLFGMVAIYTGGIACAFGGCEAAALGFARLAGLESRNALSQATTEAVSGGRNSGFLRNYIDRSLGEIQKGIRSIDRQIADHEAKLADPAKYVRETTGRDWAKMDAREQQGLMKKWESDIARQKDQQSILRDLAKDRQQCTGARLCN